METRYAALAGRSKALIDSILEHGLDSVNRQLALELQAEFRKLDEDIEHEPTVPNEFQRRPGEPLVGSPEWWAQIVP